MPIKRPYCTIYFREPKVKEFLKKHGYVYTVRYPYRLTGMCKIYFDNQYVALGDVTRITQATKDNLERYVEHSGFECVEEWVKAINRQFGKRPLSYLTIYYVKVVKWLI